MTTVARFATKTDAGGHTLALPDGSSAHIRLITPEDRPGLVSFHRHLSDTTVYMRYFSPVSLAWRTAAQRIADELCNEPDHHLALVVERAAPGSAARAVVGVGRLIIKADDHSVAEFALTIRDDFQGMGLGAALLDALIARARAESLRQIVATVLRDNRRMLQLCRERGFQVVSHDPSGTVDLALDLKV